MVTGDYFAGVQVVNVKELKARLSAYLREVARGETFLVTDRGHVVARLTPSALDVAPGGPEAAESEARGAMPWPDEPVRTLDGNDLATVETLSSAVSDLVVVTTDLRIRQNCVALRHPVLP